MVALVSQPCCGGLNEMLPIVLGIWIPGYQLIELFGKHRRCGLAGGNMPFEWALRFPSPVSFPVHVLSFLLVIWDMSSQLFSHYACCHTSQPWEPLILPEQQPKLTLPSVICLGRSWCLSTAIEISEVLWAQFIGFLKEKKKSITKNFGTTAGSTGM